MFFIFLIKDFKSMTDRMTISWLLKLNNLILWMRFIKTPLDSWQVIVIWWDQRGASRKEHDIFRNYLWPAKNISVLQRIYLYCKEYICTAKNISVLQRIHLYCKEYICTAKNISVLQRIHLYCKEYICTAKNISVLQRIYLYCKEYICTAKNISVLQRIHLYWPIDKIECLRMFHKNGVKSQGFFIRRLKMVWLVGWLVSLFNGI